MTGPSDRIAIGIHLDSISEAFNLSPDVHDPTFFSVMDRFIEIADRRGFPFSVYVIGQDLRNPDNAGQVAKWAALGHEIGNHSWSHRVDISLLDRDHARAEIRQAHEIIAKAIGHDPVGFVAPGWGQSPHTVEILTELGYEYDCSAFHSWFLLPTFLFWVVSSRGTDKNPRFLRRIRDIFGYIFKPRQPHYVVAPDGRSRLKVLPMPVTGYDMALWHSLGFKLGWDRYLKMLENCLEHSRAFYYVMHAGDLLCPSEIEGLSNFTIPRAEVPIDEKIRQFERVLDLFEKHRKRLVTVRELARECSVPEGA